MFTKADNTFQYKGALISQANFVDNLAVINSLPKKFCPQPVWPCLLSLKPLTYGIDRGGIPFSSTSQL